MCNKRDGSIFKFLGRLYRAVYFVNFKDIYYQISN